LRGEGGFYTQGGLFIHDDFDVGIAGGGGRAIEEVAEEEEDEVQNEEEYEIGDEIGQQRNQQQRRISLAATKVGEQEKPLGDGEGHKNYKQLWKWAYREACKQAGISVGTNYCA